MTPSGLPTARTVLRPALAPALHGLYSWSELEPVETTRPDQIAARRSSESFQSWPCIQSSQSAAFQRTP